MATPTTTLRLNARLRADIDRMARKSRRTFSEVTHALLDEALRMRACPGIYFADEPAGREAKMRKAFPQLSAAQIRASLLYYEKYAAEIDAEIAENATPAAELAGLIRPA